MVSLSAIALCAAAIGTHSPAHAARACDLAPWAIEGATEARTWTKAPVTPAIMMGIAAVETGGTFRKRIVGGWKGAYCGPFQVHPNNAKPLTCADLQTHKAGKAAGRILGRFTRRNGKLRDGLRLYSGSKPGNYKYADAVLAAAQRFAPFAQ